MKKFNIKIKKKKNRPVVSKRGPQREHLINSRDLVVVVVNRCRVEL